MYNIYIICTIQLHNALSFNPELELALVFENVLSERWNDCQNDQFIVFISMSERTMSLLKVSSKDLTDGLKGAPDTSSIGEPEASPFRTILPQVCLLLLLDVI